MHRPNCSWKILLIGGSSGVGKTVVARELARQLSISLLLLDDLRLALQQATQKDTHPELHIFLDYSSAQWRDPERICTDWIAVAKAMAKPLQAIVQHHLIVPDVGPILIEGDGILPSADNEVFLASDVRTVFLVEHDEKQLLRNLRARGRGFNDWGLPEQEGFAHASWLYGQWLAGEAGNAGLPVIAASPRETALERLLAIAYR